MPYRLIDLFCGAGGLTLGFKRSLHPGCPAFRSVWANDFNDSAIQTYNANFNNVGVSGDILEILSDPAFEVPQADVVIGGPPCQGFSLLNKNRADDTRKALWEPFLQIVEASGAGVFVMENVPQLRNSPEHRDIAVRANQMGFRLHEALLNAADYGAPQVRKRVFIIGCRFADPRDVLPPRPTHRKPVVGNRTLPLDGMPGQGPQALWRTVQDALAGLPAPVGTEIRDEAAPLDLHFGRNPSPISLRRYRQVGPGGNRFDLEDDVLPPCWKRKTEGGTDLFGRMWWDRPAPTIRTEFFKPEKGRYLHPEENRPITHREAARLQGFPDEFRFHGTKIEIARQIGNAVPPPLAQAVAGCVRDLLEMRGEAALEHQVLGEDAELFEQENQGVWPTRLPRRIAAG